MCQKCTSDILLNKFMKIEKIDYGENYLLSTISGADVTISVFERIRKSKL